MTIQMDAEGVKSESVFFFQLIYVLKNATATLH